MEGLYCEQRELDLIETSPTVTVLPRLHVYHRENNLVTEKGV